MKRNPRDQEKKLQDDAKLARAWTAWHREQLAEARGGPHGGLVTKIMVVLAELDIRDAGPLVAHVQAIDWRNVDAHVRFVILHEINTAVGRLRERHGLAPINDPLPGQPDRAFQRVKAALFPSSPAKAGSEFRGHGYVPGCDVTAADSAE